MIKYIADFFGVLEFHNINLLEVGILYWTEIEGQVYIFSILLLYDLIFRNYENDLKLQERYLYFLNSLFKNGDIKDIISLAYLTGILPIIRKKAQSKLNEFDNFSMLFPVRFAEFVGFTEEKAKDLCKQYGKDFWK